MDEPNGTRAPNEALVDDVFEETVPLTSFDLRDGNQREAFLCEFCKAGEPAMFEAVSQIWSSLSEPRDARCTAIGTAAGTGGQGKLALVKLLRACLKEIVTWGGTLPRPRDHPSPGEWHEATMDAWEAERRRETAVFKHYAAILDGDAS